MPTAPISSTASARARLALSPARRRTTRPIWSPALTSGFRLARGDWKMETLAKVRQILKEEDPHHPFMVGDARWTAIGAACLIVGVVVAAVEVTRRRAKPD